MEKGKRAGSLSQERRFASGDKGRVEPTDEGESEGDPEKGLGRFDWLKLHAIPRTYLMLFFCSPLSYFRGPTSKAWEKTLFFAFVNGWKDKDFLTIP